MAELILTDEQHEAVTFIANGIGAGADCLALRGLAGTGKTSIIPALRKAIEEKGVGTALGAATHRAAMVLKRKGMKDADTYHKHALVMHFKGDYAVAVEWFGEEIPCFAADHAAARPYIDGIPPLIHERLAKLPKAERKSPEDLKAEHPQHSAKAILDSIGIDGTRYFAGKGPKDGVGCLVIDEASMLSVEDLTIVKQAFPSLVLIGDPGQLPPIEGTPALEGVAGFELTKIQRQAADSPIIQLAYAAREGQNWWSNPGLKAGQLERWQGVEAREFLIAPLLVGKNSTRERCTREIREALGYPADRPVVGEPIVCRQTLHKYKNGTVFYNNALFRIVAIDPDRPMLVTLREEDSEETHETSIHFEEFGKNVPLGALRCRFGYVYTIHTAQGGEWPTVFISEPGRNEWKNTLYHMKAPADSFSKWAYTALTRAKSLLVIVDKHEWTATVRPAIETWEDYAMPRIKREDTETAPAIQPPSAPMMGMNDPEDIADPPVPAAALAAPTDAQEAMDSPVPGLPEPAAAAAASNGFIPPILPATAEPLLRGFTQYMHGQLQSLLMDESLRIAKGADLTMQAMYEYVKQVIANMVDGQGEGPKALQMIAAEGLRVHGAPYEATMSATTPEGFAVTLKVSKATPQELVQGITGLQAWLKSAGYGSAVGAEVAA